LVHKITKLILSLFSVALLGLLFFPLWVGLLVSAYLPPNVVLVDLNSRYPSFTQLTIKQISILIDGTTSVRLEGLRLKYDQSDVLAEKVAIQSISVENEKANQAFSIDLESLKSARLALSQLPLDKFAMLNSVQKISINQLNIELFDSPINLTKTTLSRLSSQSFEILTSYSDVNQTMQFKAVLDVNSEHLKFNLNANQQILAEISYSKQSSINPRDLPFTLNVAINGENLDQLMPSLTSKMKVKPIGLTRLEWLQNEQGKIDISLKGDVSINGEAVNRWLSASEMPTNNKSAIRPVNTEPTGLMFESDTVLSVKLELSGQNIFNNDNAAVKVAFNGSGTTPTSLKKGDGDIASRVVMDDITIKAHSSISLSDGNPTQLVRLHGNEIFIASKAMTATITNDLAGDVSEIAGKDFSLKVNIGSVEASITDFQSTKWQLGGHLVVGEINTRLDNQSIESTAGSDTKQRLIAELPAGLASQFTIIRDRYWLSEGNLAVPELKLDSKNTTLSGKLSGEWQAFNFNLSEGIAKFNLAFDSSQIMAVPVSEAQAQLDLKLSEDIIQGQLSASIEQVPLVTSTFEFDKNNQNLTAGIKQSKIESTLVNQFLSTFGQKNKMALQIIEGDIVHSGAALYSKDWSATNQLNIQNMLFSFGENEISGLNISEKLISISPLQFSAHLSAEQIKFSSELAINQLSANVYGHQLSDLSDVVDLTEVKAELLEGQLSAKLIRFSAGEMVLSEVQIAQLSLTELIFFMNVSGLYADGKLDLTLPVGMNNEEYFITNGRFKATEKGLIKYTRGAEESLESENIALQALRNFHYESLDGTLDYNQNGEYRIKLHLLGANPDLYDGYPIEFDLNLNGELSGVFKSLFLTGNFEEAVMQQVQTEQQ